MKEFFKKNKFNILVTAIYAVVTLIIIFFHEQWRDEAQQWLIGKDLNVFGVINQMKYEGHFLPWYFILMPFAKLGFPFITVNIISWIISTITVWLILTKSPFSKITKILLIISSPFIYYYSVISRVYCLIPLAEVLIAITYKDRFNKPFRYILSLTLLANTHIIVMGQVGVMFLEFAIESIFRVRNKKIKNKKISISIVLFIALMIFSILPIINSTNINTDVNHSFEMSKEKIIEMFIINPYIQLKSCFSYGRFNYVCDIFSFIAILVAMYLVIRNPKRAMQLIGTCIWQYFIYTFIFYTNIWRVVVIIPELMLFIWISKENDYIKNEVWKKADKVVKVSCYILLIVNSINGVLAICTDILFNYSNAKNVAKYLENNINKNSVIVTANIPECCTSIIAQYDEIHFYSVQQRRYFTFAIFDDDLRRTITKDEVIESINNLKNKNIELYYLYTDSNMFENSDKDIVIELANENILELVKTFNEYSISRDEKYVLFRVNN